MSEQCLNSETKDKMVIIIGDLINCVNDKENYLHHLKTIIPGLKTELIPKETLEKGINFLKITKENIEKIPVCNK